MIIRRYLGGLQMDYDLQCRETHRDISSMIKIPQKFNAELRLKMITKMDCHRLYPLEFGNQLMNITYYQMKLTQRVDLRTLK